jgi:tetratricopeptide (TPR) repeat protein
MFIRSFFVIAVGLFCLSSISGQTVEPSTVPVRSHVERFSSPLDRAERAESDASKRISANSSDADAFNARAQARVRLGHYAEAFEDLRRAVSLKPTVSEYQANLGYVLWKIGRAQEAIALERAALKLDEKNFTAHYQLGRFLMRAAIGDRKQLLEAADQLKSALSLDPRQLEVRFELIAVYRLLGDTAQAFAQLNVLQDARPSDPRIKYIDALLASDRNDLNAAVNGFRETLRLDPTLLGAWQDLGVAYIKLQRWPEAVETFGELSKRQPDSADAAYFYSLALYNAGRINESESEARRALRLNAGASAAQTLLGIILASRGNANAEASEALSQAAALDPQSFDAHFYLGRVRYVMRDYAEAVKSLREAVALNPRHAQARFFLGTALEAAGDSDAALTEYQELVKIDQQSAMGQIGLGALLVKQGKTSEAISTLQHAITLDPQSFEANFALGRALVLAQRFAEAVDPLRAAIKILPDRPEAHYQLGLVLRRLNRTEEAAQEFAIVEKLNTDFRTSSVPKN